MPVLHHPADLYRDIADSILMYLDSPWVHRIPAGPYLRTIRSTAGATLLDGSEWISFPSQYTTSPGMSYGAYGW